MGVAAARLRAIEPGEAVGAGPARPAGDPRRGQIDSLRAIAILAVVADHYLGLRLVLNPGVVGLRFFFLASGYLITAILLRARNQPGLDEPARHHALRSFYARRILRIWPAWLVTLGLCFWLSEPADRVYWPWHATFLANYLFSYRGEEIPWNTAHLWTLCIQEQFYLVWPLVVLWLPRRRLPWAIGGMLALSVGFRVLMTAGGWQDTLAAYDLPFGPLFFIGCGAWLAQVQAHPEDYRRWLPRSLLAAPRPVLVAALLAVCLACEWLAFELRGYLLVAVLWAAPIVLLLHGATLGYGGALGWLLDRPALQYLGRISLGIYLFHPVVADALAQAIGFEFEDYRLSSTGLLQMAVCLPVTLLAAMLSWHLLEAPINRLKRYFPYRAVAGRFAQPQLEAA